MNHPYAGFVSSLVKARRFDQAEPEAWLGGFVVVSDLDSTIRDTSPRHHLSPRRDPKRTWEDYSRACAGDLPIWGSIGVLLMADALGLSIHITTDASETGRGPTVEWLYQHRVPYDVLDMRPVGAPLPAHGEGKVAYIRELQRQGLKPMVLLEDWPGAARMVTARTGVPVLLTNPDYSPTGTEAHGM